MLSETRYAMNGDLRVAYRASRERERDIVLVPRWCWCPARSAMPGEWNLFSVAS
ncbi:MAG: hypothetical protein ACJ74F_03855 [Mycobacterium sp.]|jgi:hypothetical protein|uniref:hypothetical protein n=1 Tax=Mycobacterium sp. TaxID=1785 RepID=UPI00389A1A37